jgi:hypothetical protein
MRSEPSVNSAEWRHSWFFYYFDPEFARAKSITEALREFWRVEAGPTAGHLIPDTKLWITRYRSESAVVKLGPVRP